MSENSSNDTHSYAPAAQKIPQTSLPSGSGVHPIPNPRHNSIYSASNESPGSDVVMNGINAGEQGHHYHYPSAPSSTPRTAYPGASNSATSHSKWPGSYYQVNQYMNHSDPDHIRHITSPIISAHGVQYQQAAHTWDPTRSLQRSQPSLQDQNYPQSRTLYNNNPSYGRPPHHPVEPTATAPSPPNPYPSSPRTPQATGTSQLPPSNGLVIAPGHKQSLNSIGPVSSMSSISGSIHQQELQEQRRGYQQNSHIDNHQQHHQGSDRGAFVETLHDPPARYSPLQTNRLLNTGDARRLSGMDIRVDAGRDRVTPHPFGATVPTNSQSNYYYNSSPLSPGAKMSTSLNETLHSARYQYNSTQSGGFRYEGNKGANERANSEEQHSYIAGSESQFTGLQRPGSVEIRKASPRKVPNRHQEHIKNQHHDDTDEEDGIKRESISRTASASISPTATRSMLPGASARRDSIDSTVSTGSGKEGSKKRGGPVFTDPTGKQYYEEDIVPPGVEIPAGWQLGAGKKCLNKLLPLLKDGLPVFPEWGLTSAGKARQRLPKACASCRTKKIKCVESDQDDTKCAHCHKMRIACSQDDEEKPARKNSKKISDKKKRKDGAMDQESAVGGSASPGVTLNGAQGSLGFPKKRKASDDGQKSGGGFLKRGKSSRDSSFSMEPIEEKTAVMNNPLDSTKSTLRHHQQPQTQTLVQSQKLLTFATESAAPMNVTDEGRTSRNYSARLLADQYPPGSYGMVGIQPATGATPNSFTSASPTTPDHPAIYRVNNSYSSSSKALSATPTITETPTLSCVPLPMGEDPRHSNFPSPNVVNHLVEMYFKYVYSQTYAFLHKQTFMKKLDSQPDVLIVSLCTVAARFSTKCSHMEESLASQARELIFKNYDNYCLEVVQSMIHMGLHDFGSNQGDKAWMFCGMAVRMGTALNLNLENGRAKVVFQSPIARESARRTFWSYYLMDRFNSYGVARPFLTQDHDCHVQLPCNQPSFRDGYTVVTEHLLGPNPAEPDVGTIHMGAMAFLVRVVGIWGNILKQIHLSGFEKGGGKEAEFQSLIEKLETWRKSLPSGLEYSNENLAGQITVGTAGAFVTMHVMWHTAMAYVHRYVRIITKQEGTNEEGQSILDESIITSIRKTFVHADAVLLIMSHVKQRRKEAKELGETEVIVNAPFLGQAISDACDISIIRALESKGDPDNILTQKDRIYVGLMWLKELRGYWKPLEGMYRKLRKAYNKHLDKIVSQTQPGMISNVIPSPDSGNGSEMITDYPMFQFPIDPATYDLHPDMGMHLSAPGPLESQQWLCLPESYYEAAFAGSSMSLYGIAEAEGGFPQLYIDHHGMRDDMVMATSLAPDSDMTYQPAILDQPSMPLMSHQSFDQLNAHRHSDPDPEDSDNDYDDEKEGADDGDGQSITSSKKREKAKSNISTLYFHPSAVLDGKLGDSSGSESSGLDSRRQSEAAPKPEHNRMDVLNLLISASVTQYVRRAVEKHNDSDLGTGRQGIMVPDDCILKGEVNTDNSKDNGHSN